MRIDGRSSNANRPTTFELGVNRYAPGSCIIQMGHTRVHCTASLTDELPRWRRSSGKGWVTAEYRMLPHATHDRGRREGSSLKGRTAEIQRLIGRSLRAAVDFDALGPWSLTIDCDVLQADGGTRCASINGGYVAMASALQSLVNQGKLPKLPLLHSIGAVSLGIVKGQALVDLCYEEDFAAEVDLNLVMTGDGRLIEVQGTAEEAPYTFAQLNDMLSLGAESIAELTELQNQALQGAP
jgi:ribonuclease PH